MLELFDEYCWTKQKKIITRDKHGVVGLGNVSYYNITSSSSPSPMHYHSDIMEIHCMIKGTRFTQIEKDGQLSLFETTGNQALITYPFELHSNGNKPQAPCEFYAFQLNISDPYSMLGLNRAYSYTLNRRLTQLKSRHIGLNSDSIRLLKSVFERFSRLAPDSTMFACQELTCFLLGLSEMPSITDTNVTEMDARIKRSIDYLNANLRECLQLSDMAEVSGYSLSRFKVRFKDSVGITPAEYIAMQKIELAKQMLSESDISITELAYELGYSSSNYFSTVFKKLMRCTPQGYRRQLREK